MILALITVESPFIEIIAIGDLFNVMIQLIGASKARSLIGNHDVRVSAASGFASAMPNRRIGFVSICRHIDTIFTGALNLEGQVWSIHFEMIFIVEVPDSYNDGTLRQLQLGCTVIELQEGDAGFRIHPN
jgi:hypothetical protein